MKPLVYLVVFISFSFTFAPLSIPQEVYPVPEKKKNMLYYLQRTTNTNTIVYELNYDKDSVLNKEEPIHVYWIRYADGGHTAELSYLQKHYAYGLECESIGNGNYKFHFVSYKKTDLYLVKSKAGNQYHAYVSLNNTRVLLQKIFVKIEGGSFWFPAVKYVEITGINPETGKGIVQKIII